MLNWTRKALFGLSLSSPLLLLSACGGGGSDGLFDTPPASGGGASVTAPAAIEYVQASPTTIALQGVGQAGLTQTSQVTFKVVDAMGAPVAGKSVAVRLSTEAGGMKVCTTASTCTNPTNPDDLDTVSGVTGEDGTITVSVVSGSVQTSVWVIATVAGTTISTQSINLVATTSVPDQDSFSLSVSTFNPEGYNIDGTEVDVTARLADRYNNSAPDGTQVLFTTEGGSIVGSCVTSTGACSVKWTSQSPRPSNGRVNLLAYALGEESYIENDGDGRFGFADGFNLTTQDIHEAFRDDNEDGMYNPGEDFRDFNNNGRWDAANGLFNGWLCDDTTRCASTHSIHVFGNALIVMAESFATITPSASSISLEGADPAKSQPFTVTVVGRQTGQVMPAGTTIEVSTTHGTIEDPSSYTVPNTPQTGAGSSVFNFTVKGAAEQGSGLITIKVTTPNGNETTRTITIEEAAPPAPPATP